MLGVANRVLGLQRHQARWSVESVHTKNIVSILHLLVALARHFRAPIRLPENVVVDVVIVTKREGVLTHRVIAEELTSYYDDVGMRCERDAFDTLFDHAPDKLQVVKKSLVTFVNKHLNKINLEVTELDSQFSDGVYLCLLSGLLEGYFVPLYDFHLTPQVPLFYSHLSWMTIFSFLQSFEEKVANVSLAFELMMDGGLPQPKVKIIGEEKPLSEFCLSGPAGRYCQSRSEVNPPRPLQSLHQVQASELNALRDHLSPGFPAYNTFDKNMF